MTLTTRPSQPADAAAIDAICQHVYGMAPGAAGIIETTLLCLTALEGDEVVGFLCVDDSVALRFGCGQSGLSWVQEKGASRLNSSSAFVWIAAYDELYELEASGALLKAAFLALGSLQKLLLATDNDITFKEPGLAAAFECVTQSREEGCFLYEAPRLMVLPALSIREARVEDHDDMVPVLEASEKRFPALAKIPEEFRPEEAFALSRLVAGQDDNNTVLVAISEGKLVGFMVLTTEVDTSSLLGSFDLHPYDNFLQEDTYDLQYEAAKNSLQHVRVEQLRAELRARRKQYLAERDEAIAAGEDVGEEEPEPEFDEAAAAEPSDAEVSAEMQRMFPAEDQSAADLSVFAMTMFCMLDGYESEAAAFMETAFSLHPEHNYCIVTLPHMSEEPALMADMTRLSPLPGMAFPEVLYLMNRNAMLKGFDVRMGELGDIPAVSELVAGMPNADAINESFQRAADVGVAVVATVSDQVVGLVTISKDGVDLERLKANFDFSNLMNMAYHPKEKHGEIDVYCMNPIFAHRLRDMLSGAQRLLKLTSLYYALPPGQSPPDLLHVLQQVPPRHRQLPLEGTNGVLTQVQAALYCFTRKGGFLRRRTINSQIVVVGASECGLACVERLLLDTHLSFNYVTLLAPGGVSVGGPACEYSAGLVSRLGLEARVRLVDAEMIGLDVNEQVIELSDETQMAYDLLLVTCGLQEQTRSHVAETDPEVAAAVVNAAELGADFSLEDAARMRDIVVYGNTLESYHALAVLEKRGAGEISTFVAPPGEEHPLAHVLRLAAGVLGKAKCPLPDPAQLTLQEMVAKDSSSSRLTAVFANPNTPEAAAKELVIDLLVGCRAPDVSPWVFASLNDAGVVYDGRIVVDGAFRTSSPSVYAAGTAAKLSRRYGRDVRFEHYNSKECGFKLAESVAALCLGTQDPERPPAMHMPRVVGCALPGGLSFLYAGVPSAMMEPNMDKVPEGQGRLLQTSTQWGLMQVKVGADERVQAAVCLGKREVQASKLASLVGLHVSYLNGLIQKFDAGEIPDLILFFSEPWADLLHHDQFWQLRQELLAPYLVDALASGSTPPEEVGAHVRDLVLDFIRARVSEFPSYALPASA